MTASIISFVLTVIPLALTAWLESRKERDDTAKKLAGAEQKDADASMRAVDAEYDRLQHPRP